MTTGAIVIAREFALLYRHYKPCKNEQLPMSFTYPVVLTSSKCIVVLQLWKRIRIPRWLWRHEDRRTLLDAAFRQCRRYERCSSGRRHWLGDVRDHSQTCSNSVTMATSICLITMISIVIVFINWVVISISRRTKQFRNFLLPTVLR